MRRHDPACAVMACGVESTTLTSGLSAEICRQFAQEMQKLAEGIRAYDA
jgi:hypothetical protein